MNGWSVIITFTYPHEAYLAKGFLESEGIETLVKDELTVQVDNFLSNAISGVKLLVRDEDYERGIEVLKQGGYIVNSGSVDSTEPEIVIVDKNTDLTECPFCHSTNFGKKQKLNVVSVVLYFIFSALFPLFRSSYKCYDCGKEWKYKKQSGVK